MLLHHGRIEAAGDGRRSLSRRLGLQAHHDDIKVADGEVTRIDVRPDWRAVDTIGVTVMLQPLRPTRQTSGRALQIASDPARIVRDGVAYPRPVTRWTWYADHRVRWLLQPLSAPRPRGRTARGQARRGHWTAPGPEEAPLPTSCAPTGWARR